MTNIASKEKTVMLIDDNDIDNFINEKIVKNSNFTKHVFVHTSALSALEFLKDIEIIEKNEVLDIVPSYIFLDNNMPIADGFYFLEEYKKISDKIKSRIKIIVLTSSPSPDDEERSLAYGEVVKFMLKPLTQEGLASLN